MKTKKKANPIKFLEGLQKDKKKMAIILTEDKLHSMLFDVEWDLADKTHDLIKVLKTRKVRLYDGKTTNLVDKIENLLEKRMNILSAQCLVYDEEEK